MSLARTASTAIMLIALIGLAACEKAATADPLPTPSLTVPVVTTVAATTITQTTASSGGDVISDGGGTVTARGVCWSTDTTPTMADSVTSDGSGTGGFSITLTNLTANTVYHVRAYATNGAGTGYGNEVSFATLPAAADTTVTDIDGNVYKTVRIGDQLWMADNLRTTRYSNGDPIPHVTDRVAWVALTTPAYCWYGDSETTFGATYGALYNWYAADSASNDNRSICPAGWHIPTEAEWTTLTTYLGGIDVAGGKMKEAGTSHWLAPNTGATNGSKFSGLPGGYRGYTNGAYDNVGLFGHWWSSTSRDASQAWGEGLFALEAPANHSPSVKKNGFSIRCVKD